MLMPILIKIKILINLTKIPKKFFSNHTQHYDTQKIVYPKFIFDNSFFQKGQLCDVNIFF